MVSTERFYRFAQEFQLLAMALDNAGDPDSRKELLGRMKAMVDEMDEAIRQEAVDSRECLNESMHTASLRSLWS